MKLRKLLKKIIERAGYTVHMMSKLDRGALESGKVYDQDRLRTIHNYEFIWWLT